MRKRFVPNHFYVGLYKHMPSVMQDFNRVENYYNKQDFISRYEIIANSDKRTCVSEEITGEKTEKVVDESGRVKEESGRVKEESESTACNDEDDALEIEELTKKDETPPNKKIETRSQVENDVDKVEIQYVSASDQCYVSEILVAREDEVKIDEQLCGVEKTNFVDFVGVEKIRAYTNKLDTCLFSVLDCKLQVFIHEQHCDSRTNRLEERGNDENRIHE
ncbi:uncharacterized protein [Euphorbia lathyris]|uniref:uncharacterized protein n=1 Tax=Euphorbia lathyris TaxID=212925 RepID=UPI0033136F33